MSCNQAVNSYIPSRPRPKYLDIVSRICILSVLHAGENPLCTVTTVLSMTLALIFPAIAERSKVIIPVDVDKAISIQYRWTGGWS